MEIFHIPRNLNQKADALSKLAGGGDPDKDQPVVVLEVPQPSINIEYVEKYNIFQGDEWYLPIWDFLKEGTLPSDESEAKRIKRVAPRYAVIDDFLYHRGYVTPWQKCISTSKVPVIIREVHEGLCGSHQGAKTLAHRILRAGYF